MIKIVTDSTSDLPQSYLDRYDIGVVPIVIHFGQDSFLDGIDIDHQTFYAMIEERGTLPKTSQPSPGDFADMYQKIAAEGKYDQILSLHVTSKLSGTFHSAGMAGEMVKDSIPVTAFDSMAGSAALGYMCVEAARMSQSDASLPDILARLEEIRADVNLFLALADLRFAQMSGRVGRLQGTLASLLNVKPIIHLQDGVIDVMERVRTQGRAIDRMLELSAERVGSDPVSLAIIHAQAPQKGESLLQQARSMFNCRESYLHDLAPSLAVHFGPGTLGVVTYSI
jgi:DegV family protein with EDD domain